MDHLLYAELDPRTAERLTADALKGLEDGELFLQVAASESFAFDDGRLKSASFDQSRGFGLRGVMGEVTGYAHANEISEPAIRRAAETLQVVKAGGGDIAPAAPPQGTNRRLYTDADPLSAVPFAAKVELCLLYTSPSPRDH
jgi:TldD protein